MDKLTAGLMLHNIHVSIFTIQLVLNCTIWGKKNVPLTLCLQNLINALISNMLFNRKLVFQDAVCCLLVLLFVFVLVLEGTFFFPQIVQFKTNCMVKIDTCILCNINLAVNLSMLNFISYTLYGKGDTAFRVMQFVVYLSSFLFLFLCLSEDM
jgi:hypothetical protein